MSKKRRKFSKEFKENAVRLVSEEKQSVGVTARNLGINETMLRRWKTELTSNGSAAFPGKGNQAETVEAELNRLREENRRLRMEREILKKATAFFAKENA